jgi:hypothetical protein
MKAELLGKTLLRTKTRAHAVKIAELSTLLGTASATQTARMVPFFGPTVAGEAAFVEALGLNLSRALLAGHELEFERPFEPDEPVEVELILAEYSEKNGMQVGTIESKFCTPEGQLIQRQKTTFIERMA